MRNFLAIIFIAFVSALSAQQGWNWPEEKNMFDLAQEKQALYKGLMMEEKYEEALVQLKWLFDNNPSLNPSIYIDGTKCIEEVIKSIENEERVVVLKDSALWMYDARILHFGNKASVLDRKARSTFKYYYKNPAKYPLIISAYEKAFDLNGAGISDFNITPYMTIAKYSYDRRLAEMPAEKVLGIHSMLSNILDEKEKSGKDMTVTRNKIDALLSSLDGLISCEYIAAKLVPRLENNPNDLNTAKKIFTYSLSAKCSDRPYFMDAAETLIKYEPTYTLANVLAEKWYASGDYARAAERFNTALELAQNDQDAYEALMGNAKTSVKLGMKSLARDYAFKALSKKPDATEPYNLIGNLYFLSFDECASKQDIVLDRAIYIAAYEMYRMASNLDRMAAAKEQFPSIEDIFDADYEESQKVKIGCWINIEVTLKRR